MDVRFTRKIEYNELLKAVQPHGVHRVPLNPDVVLEGLLLLANSHSLPLKISLPKFLFLFQFA